MDIQTIVVSILAGGSAGAVVSKILENRDRKRRESRDDAAFLRRLRAVAHSLSIRVAMARQYGFSNMPDLEAYHAELRELLRDPSVLRAISDSASRALHEAVDLCAIFVKFSKDTGIDPASSIAIGVTPDSRSAKQNLFSNAAKPTFDMLREAFVELNEGQCISLLDKAEEERQRLERIARGLE